jgi:hypothetical protein
MVNRKALRDEVLTEDELLAVVHRQGFEDFDEVQMCSLAPNGSFYVKGRKPSQEDERHAMLLLKLEELAGELRSLKTIKNPSLSGGIRFVKILPV